MRKDDSVSIIVVALFACSNVLLPFGKSYVDDGLFDVTKPGVTLVCIVSP